MNLRRRWLLLVLVSLACSPPLAWAQAPGAAAPPAPPTNLTRERIEQFLLTSRLVSVRDVRQGVTGTRRATFADDATQTWTNINVCDVSYVTLRFNKDGAPTFAAN